MNVKSEAYRPILHDPGNMVAEEAAAVQQRYGRPVTLAEQHDLSCQIGGHRTQIGLNEVHGRTASATC